MWSRSKKRNIDGWMDEGGEPMIQRNRKGIKSFAPKKNTVLQCHIPCIAQHFSLPRHIASLFLVRGANRKGREHEPAERARASKENEDWCSALLFHPLAPPMMSSCRSGHDSSPLRRPEPRCKASRSLEGFGAARICSAGLDDESDVASCQLGSNQALCRCCAAQRKRAGPSPPVSGHEDLSLLMTMSTSFFVLCISLPTNKWLPCPLRRLRLGLSDVSVQLDEPLLRRETIDPCYSTCYVLYSSSDSPRTAGPGLAL